jgi:hypothetical protein
VGTSAHWQALSFLAGYNGMPTPGGTMLILDTVLSRVLAPNLS